jgi:hypothetical protein
MNFFTHIKDKITKCESFQDNIPRKLSLEGYHRKYDAIKKCKSAGIIPYCIDNGKLLFLFQRLIPMNKDGFINGIDSIRLEREKRDFGWNDFGGKRIDEETTIEIAAREFSEETCCLFYLKEQDNEEDKILYDTIIKNKKLKHMEFLNQIIPLSKTFFMNKISMYIYPIHVNSKEIYISYLVKVRYIDSKDIPIAEDLHMPYEDRYLRECKWFTYDELMKMNETAFHKRLQITKLQNRIKSYYHRGLFT